MGSWAVSFFLVLWGCGGFTWNMGNACKGNLLRLQSCFLVVESFSMFHVEHGSFSCRENMIQLLKTLMHVTILWRFGKAS